jgi:hypothetical protein
MSFEHMLLLNLFSHPLVKFSIEAGSSLALRVEVLVSTLHSPYYSTAFSHVLDAPLSRILPNLPFQAESSRRDMDAREQ